MKNLLIALCVGVAVVGGLWAVSCKCCNDCCVVSCTCGDDCHCVDCECKNCFCLTGCKLGL